MGLLIIIINYIMYQAIIIIKYEMVLLYLKNILGVHHIHLLGECIVGSIIANYGK